MIIVLGPTWSYVQCDKLLTLGHASVGVGYGTLSHSRHCVEGLVNILEDLCPSGPILEEESHERQFLVAVSQLATCAKMIRAVMSNRTP